MQPNSGLYYVTPLLPPEAGGGGDRQKLHARSRYPPSLVKQLRPLQEM